MKQRKVVDHAWECVGVDAGAYCQDCKQPANELRHLQRAGHHLYVCLACAVERQGAAPLRVAAEAQAVARTLWEIALTRGTLPALIDLRDRYDWLKEED